MVETIVQWQASMVNADGSIGRYLASNKRQARLGLFHAYPWTFEYFEGGHKISYAKMEVTIKELKASRAG